MFLALPHGAVGGLQFMVLVFPDHTHLLFLANLNHWLRVSYCDHWMSVVRRISCVVRRQQLLQTTSPPKLLAGF